MDMSKEIKTIDMELELMKYFDYRKNIIVPTLTKLKKILVFIF